ncbi:MAG: hypothetical protein K2X69_04275 [Silvanigrellaceae bacterium]|nr:hypothetical protein [Silvanigrellaceae bacterium]
MNEKEFNAEYIRELRASEVQKEKEEFDIKYDKLINKIKNLILKNSSEDKKYLLITNDDCSEFNKIIKNNNGGENLVNYFNSLGFKTEFTHTRERRINGKEIAEFKIKW